MVRLSKGMQMLDRTVALVPVGNDRFCLVLSDVIAPSPMGPSVGDDPDGYTEDTLYAELRDRHRLSDADIATLIAAAQAKRAQGG